MRTNRFLKVAQGSLEEATRKIVNAVTGMPHAAMKIVFQADSADVRERRRRGTRSWP